MTKQAKVISSKVVTVFPGVDAPVYKPSFEISDREYAFLGDKKQGQTMNVYMTFTIVEKTKSFVTFRIDYMYKETRIL